MLRLQKVQAIKRPSKRNQGSLYQMVTQNIVYGEGKWICRSDDLAALAHGAEHGWFNVKLENWLGKLSREKMLVSTLLCLSSHLHDRQPCRPSMLRLATDLRRVEAQPSNP